MKASMTMMHVRERQVVSGWMLYGQVMRENYFKAIRASRKMIYVRKRQTFDVWCIRLEEKIIQRRQRRIQRLYVKLLQKRALSMAFETWVDFVVEYKRHWDHVVRVGVRYFDGILRRSVQAWYLTSKEEKRKRVLSRAVKAQGKRSCLHSVLRSWMLVITVEKYARTITEMARVHAEAKAQLDAESNRIARVMQRHIHHRDSRYLAWMRQRTFFSWHIWTCRTKRAASMQANLLRNVVVNDIARTDRPSVEPPRWSDRFSSWTTPPSVATASDSRSPLSAPSGMLRTSSLPPSADRAERMVHKLNSVLGGRPSL